MTKFGITEETKSKNLVPFKVTKEHPLNVGFLTKVIVEEIEKKDQSKTNALVFYFTDEKNERSHREVEWILDETDAKFTDKLNALQSRIKHIYEEFAPFPKGGIGTKAKDMLEFLKEIEIAFNINKDGKAIFTNIPIWIKLTYWKGNLKFPYSPNFIEKVKVIGDKRKETLLTVNPKYDKVENDADSSNKPTELGIVSDNSFQEDFPPFS